MHTAQTAFELLAYTPSNKHFGLTNTQLLLAIIIGGGLVVWLFKK